MAYWYTGSAFFQIPQSYHISYAIPMSPKVFEVVGNKSLSNAE